MRLTDVGGDNDLAKRLLASRSPIDPVTGR